MSLSFKTNRPSDDANIEAPARKKTKLNQVMHDKQWEMMLAPFLRVASKSQVENLAKVLFTELSKRNDTKELISIIAPTMASARMNLRLADSYWDLDCGGSILIYDGLQYAQLWRDNAAHVHHVDGLELKSSNDMDTLVYEGEAEGHHCDYKVKLSLKYDADSDTINGYVESNLFTKTPIEENYDFCAFRNDDDDE